MFGRCIHRETGSDPMAGARGDVDEMPDFLLFHIRQRRGDTVQHPLDVHVDHPIPLVDLEALKQRLRDQPGIVDHHIDPSEGAHCGIEQSFDLLAVNDVRRNGESLTPLRVGASANAWMRFGPRGEMVRRPLAGRLGTVSFDLHFPNPLFGRTVCVSVCAVIGAIVARAAGRQCRRTCVCA
jgi:hypothetical protein